MMSKSHKYGNGAAALTHMTFLCVQDFWLGGGKREESVMLGFCCTPSFTIHDSVVLHGKCKPLTSPVGENCVCHTDVLLMQCDRQ